jgi:hypothetical protein
MIIILMFQILLLLYYYYMIQVEHNKLKLFNHRTLLYWCLISPPKCPWKDICQYITAWMCLQQQHCHMETKRVQSWWAHELFLFDFWSLCIILGSLKFSFPCGLWAQVHRLDRESSGLILMGRTKESFTRLHWLFTSVNLAKTSSQVINNSLITNMPCSV